MRPGLARGYGTYFALGGEDTFDLIDKITNVSILVILHPLLRDVLERDHISPKVP
ncbi:hypothetical protein LP7551_05512 [Roseibium album]|nr:hypothetical protein LP7551_05512 [Roseibium album]